MRRLIKLASIIFLILCIWVTAVIWNQPISYASANYPVLLLKNGRAFSDRIATFDLSLTYASHLNCEDFKKLHEKEYPDGGKLECVIFNNRHQPMQIIEKQLPTTVNGELAKIKYIERL